MYPADHARATVRAVATGPQRIPWPVVGALVILVGAAVLRLGDLGLMEYKGDEAVAIELARPMVEGQALPRVGLVSSVGVHNPPLFIWLTALPLWVDHDPRFITGAMVGLLSLLSIGLTFWFVRRRFGDVTALLATGFYAFSTWPVLYARKIWAQDVVPVFSTLLLWALVVVWERPKTRWVAAVPVLCATLWQLHFSAFATILVCAGLLLARGRNLSWGWLAAGIVLGLLTMGPWLQHQADNDWADVRGLAKIAGGERPDGSKRNEEKRWTLDPARWAAYAASGTDIGYSTGSKDLDGGVVGRAAGVAGHALLGVGCLALLWGAIRKRNKTALILVTWLLGYVAIYLLVRLENVYPHYFIILYPAPFIAMAVPLVVVAGRSTAATAAVAVLAVAIVAGHLLTLSTMRTAVKSDGGFAGDYGIAYEHKAAATDWIVAHGLQPIAAPGFEYRQLVSLVRRYGEAPPVSSQKVRIYDTLRAPKLAHRKCRGRQDFGPLVLCPR